MAAWDASTALGNLRSLLGDTETDKFEFRGNATPSPDGVTQRFFAGDSRLVPGTLDVYVAGVSVAPSGEDYSQGTFTMAPIGVSGFPVAVAAGVEIQCSYYYQWFSDTDLLACINQGLMVLSASDVTDPALPLEVRPVVLQYAAHFAYMYKAAEYASQLSAGAPGGYALDRKTASPNWLALAKMAYDTADKLLKLYNDRALVRMSPSFAFVKYCLPTYVPRS